MCAALNEKLSVLLIAEAPRTHQAILTLLQDQGFSVGIATDGDSAYQKSQLMVPDLILLDSAVPRVPALSLVRKLRGLSATSGIPIIYLANGYFPEGGAAALRAGAVDYLSFPYLAEELLERIQIHIRLSNGVVSERLHDRPSNGSAPIAASGTQMEDQMLTQAADGAIRESLHAPLTQKALASMLQVSERRLATAFMRRWGVLPPEYIRRQRLKKAERLISTTTLSLALIAEELGFSSPANFSTAFKKYKGVSPLQFRKSPKEEV